MEELIDEIIKWGKSKGIDNASKQFIKLAEETLEAHEAFNVMENNIFHFGQFNIEKYYKDLELELGDIGVVWVILCNILDVDPYSCLYKAHTKNKIRKGKTINGNFIKEDDL